MDAFWFVGNIFEQIDDDDDDIDGGFGDDLI